jgi:D-tagatose-1,6-bisphosphate aldolase subunit GatZ/KbaZ
MLADPRHWRPFYPEDRTRAALARRYSRSDRSRYYWPVPAVQQALAKLHENLESTGLPDELVSQYLPWLSSVEVPGSAMSSGRVGGLTSDAVLRASVRRVLEAYASAV